MTCCPGTPQEPREEPYGLGFTVRDPEGVFWSFGTYKGTES